MDDHRFDTFIRALTTPASRRPAVGLILAGAAGWIGLAKSEAKKKRVTLCLNGQTLTVKKSKKAGFLGRGATQGACAASPPPPRPASPPVSPPTSPPPPAASCSDGVKNGNETDVDCGGSCGRCESFRDCTRGADCQTGVCAGGQCLPCESDGQCEGGPATCFCSEQGVCSDRAFRFVNTPSCNFCPEGTVSCSFFSDGGANNGVLCSPRCGEPFPE